MRNLTLRRKGEGAKCYFLVLLMEHIGDERRLDITAIIDVKLSCGTPPRSDDFHLKINLVGKCQVQQ